MSGPVDVLQPVHEALVRRLEADAPLMAIVSGIYHGKADNEATYPYVVFAVQDAPDRTCFQRGGYTEIVYLLKVVDRGFSGQRASQAAARFGPAIDDDTLWDADGIRVTAVDREQVIDSPETDGDTVIQHIGGLWKVWAEKA